MFQLGSLSLCYEGNDEEENITSKYSDFVIITKETEALNIGIML
jgi:hypothetical protein